MNDSPALRLMDCLLYWQERLRLQDWKIFLQQAAPDELEKSQARARVDMRPFQREATIVLRRLDVCDEATESEIVHELLHMVFAQYGLWMGAQDESAHMPMEQAINATGAALVELRREVGGMGFDCPPVPVPVACADVSSETPEPF